MKKIITLILTLTTITGFGQQMNINEWEEQSKNNIRLLPKYGHAQKNEAQKQSDQDFINETKGQEQFNGDRTAASNHMIDLGFNYLYRGDLKTAMYRFNQAYLLDSLNAEIYWGYGAVYMTLGDYERAKQLYNEGLVQDPANTHLLTDLGTCYMGQYYRLESVDMKVAMTYLDTAIEYMLQSYELDKTDPNTTFKLSVCYWIKEDCDNAWRFYEVCESLGGQPITEAYTKDLKKKCKR